MRYFILSFCLLLLPLHQDHKNSQVAQKPTQEEQRGTEESPVVVKVLPSAESAQQSEAEEEDRKEKATADKNLVNATWVLAAIGVLQLIVFGIQAAMLKKTVDAGTEQSKSMERHIGEAARSATAMERIADKIQEGNKAVLRAYLTVTVGQALWQERRGPGQSDLKFEARPFLVNTGNTPARKVRVRIHSDILPVPLPEDFQYPLPELGDNAAHGNLGARQTNIMYATVKDFVPFEEIGIVKEGTRKALYVWGEVSYQDIFGDGHLVTFAQHLTWNPDNSLMAYFIPGRNDAD